MLNSIEYNKDSPTNNVLGYLFYNYGETVNNIVYNRNMYYERISIVISIFIPIPILFSFGIVLIRNLVPAAIGYLVIFVGLSIISFGYGICLWKNDGWRMQRRILYSFVFGVLCLIAYMFGALFSSIRPVSFFSVTTIFLMVNSALMCYFLFLQNSHLRKIQITIQDMLKFFVLRHNKKKDKESNESKTYRLSSNKRSSNNSSNNRRFSGNKRNSNAIKFLMASKSSLATSDKNLLSSTPSDGIINSARSSDRDSSIGNDNEDIENGIQFKITDCIPGAFSIDPDNPYFEYTESFNKVYENNIEDVSSSYKIYGIALFDLFLYIITVPMFDKDMGVHGFVVALSCVVLDAALFSLTRSKSNIGPFMLSIMVIISRLWFCIWMGNYWLVGHIFAYATFALIMSSQIIYTYITPTLNDKNNSHGLINTGVNDKVTEEENDKRYNYLDTELPFIFSTIYFVILIALSDTLTDLPDIEILDIEIKEYMLGVCVLVFVLLYTFSYATLRAFYLQFRGEIVYLNKDGKKPLISFPMRIAIITEIVFVACAVVYHFSTDQLIVPILLGFLPAIIIISFNIFLQYWENGGSFTENPKFRNRNDYNIMDEYYNSVEYYNLYYYGTTNKKEVERWAQNFELPPLDRKVDDNNINRDKTEGVKVNTIVQMPDLPNLGSLFDDNNDNDKNKTLPKRNGPNFNSDTEYLTPSKSNFKVKMPSLPPIITQSTIHSDQQPESEVLSGGSKSNPNQKEQNQPASKTTESETNSNNKIPEVQPESESNKNPIPVVTTPNEEKGEGEKKSNDDNKKDDNNENIPLLQNDDLEAGKVGASKPPIPTSNLDKNKTIDPAEMSIMKAFFTGNLTSIDYQILALFIIDFILVAAMGILISVITDPHWVGGFVSLTIVSLFFTLEPVFRYFHRYKFTPIIIFNSIVGTLFFIGTLVYLFGMCIEWRLSSSYAMLYLMILFVYPSAIFLFCAIYRWYDNNWKNSELSHKLFWPSYVLLFICHIFLYFFTPSYVAVIVSLVLVLGLVLMYYIYIWSKNGYSVSVATRVRSIALCFILFVIAFIISLIIDINLAYTFSGFIGFIAIGYLFDMCQIFYTRKSPSLYFSPYIFPIYSFDSMKLSLQIDNHFGIDVIIFLMLFTLWGSILTALVHPIEFGLIVISISIIIVEAFYTYCQSQVPFLLANQVMYLGDSEIKYAIHLAMEEYKKRRGVLIIDGDSEKIEIAPLTTMTHKSGKAKTFNMSDKDLLGESNILQTNGSDINLDIENNNRNNNNNDDTVHEIIKPNNNNEENKYNNNEEDNEEIKVVRNALNAAIESFNNKTDLYSFRTFIQKIIPQEDGTQEHIQEEIATKRMNGLWTFSDFWENTMKGMGALGCLSPSGLFNCFYNSKKNVIPIAGQDHPLVTREKLESVIPLDDYLKHEFNEEYRCLLHFICMLIEAAQERVSSEQNKMIKLLRREKYSLVAKNIIPPSKIFLTENYSSIEVKIINDWYSNLDHKTKSLFKRYRKKAQKLKKEEMEETLQLDKKLEEESKDLSKKYKEREYEVLDNYHEQLEERREEFLASDETVPENLSEIDYCSLKLLEEISRGRQAILTSVPGRQIQYCDFEFSPSIETVGKLPPKVEPVCGWESALSINPHVKLFGDNGTDARDIYEGIISDSWLVGAMAMLANYEKNDKGVSIPISKMIINNELSETGAYIINLYKYGVFQPIIVDDFFPVISRNFRETKCASVAMCYTSNFNSLWPSLIEKAFAKYRGCYTELQKGFVKEALEMMTGYPAEEIKIYNETRNIHRIIFWENLLRSSRNGYIMGVAVMTGFENEKEYTSDYGILTNTVYPICDVREVDGNQLIKLKYPSKPDEGDLTWKGDWNSNSSLWTSRINYKLNKNDEKDDENTFWMCLDDFCNAFKSLYICYYLLPEKWTKQIINSEWSKRDGTATGLPSISNPNCNLTKAPHYKLRLRRVTEIVIKLRQCDSNGDISKKLLPISMYVVQNPYNRYKQFRLSELTHANIISYSGNPRNEIEIEIRCTLKRGCYGIIVATLDPVESPYQLTVYSSEKLKVSKMCSVEQLKHLDDKLFKMPGKEVENNEKELDHFKPKINKVLSSDSIKQKTKPKWKVFYDETNKRKYYYDTLTGKSVWEKPPDFNVGRKVKKIKIEGEEEENKKENDDERAAGLESTSTPNAATTTTPATET